MVADLPDHGPDLALYHVLAPALGVVYSVLPLLIGLLPLAQVVGGISKMDHHLGQSQAVEGAPQVS